MKKFLFSVFLGFSLLSFRHASAQVPAISSGEIHGNFQADIQTYRPDSSIGAPEVPEKVLMNGFANLIYTNGSFSAGVRYESYLNPLQGFDPRYKGTGIPYRYATYSVEGLEVTVGNYYEQFGSGLIFRSYEERGLGLDNAMDGLRLRYSPIKGLNLKGIFGKQRFFFSQGPGIVRGADGELTVNELFSGMTEAKTRLTFGGSFMSKYQEDLDPTFNLPENVAAFASRMGISSGALALYAEYASKINDPSSTNGFIFKPGESFLISASYSQKGMGASVSAKRVDNMDFRSDRTATGNVLNLNFLPPITKQHTYQLVTIYPYATQPNGEVGLQADFFYTFKPGTPLGGTYGTNVAFNASRVHNIDTMRYNDDRGYRSDFLKVGKQLYFQDFNIEITRKINKSLKVVLSDIYLIYNKDVIQGLSGYGTVYANIAIADITYKLNNMHSLRTELQHLNARQDEGSWAMALFEYSVAPHWIFSVFDQYNYGNKDSGKQIHYYSAGVAYNRNSLRISLSYGKQRAGLLCVGGVCRYVPASNGATLTISSSF